mmetsp:Transcript_5642/g.7885  ORF Transcript_5642/g.7885 Transcript_5642/m.7885 type:complete len:165 (-) Transcript_5642:1220-1714(-)
MLSSYASKALGSIRYGCLLLKQQQQYRSLSKASAVPSLMKRVDPTTTPARRVTTPQQPPLLQTYIWKVLVNNPSNKTSTTTTTFPRPLQRPRQVGILPSSSSSQQHQRILGDVVPPFSKPTTSQYQMGRNSRKPMRANHGKRPNSHWARRRKKKIYGYKGFGRG